ncbi:MAG TPA: hypothetical protein PL132_08125 [Prolixibacteraceae bacterium]|nr:hypothetical protein [Prolixibacteraceae bacterium]
MNLDCTFLISLAGLLEPDLRFRYHPVPVIRGRHWKEVSVEAC